MRWIIQIVKKKKETDKETKQDHKKHIESKRRIINKIIHKKKDSKQEDIINKKKYILKLRTLIASQRIVHRRNIKKNKLATRDKQNKSIE